MEEFKLPDSAEPADDATRAMLLTQAELDHRHQALRAYLAAHDFTIIGAPAVYVARLKEVTLRSVVVMEYVLGRDTAQASNPKTPTVKAGLGFGLENTGTTWVQATVYKDGRVDYFLHVNDAGDVEVINATDPPS